MRAFIGAYTVAVALAAAIMLSGCSVKFELGYHGRTGTDDRQASALAPKSTK